MYTSSVFLNNLFLVAQQIYGYLWLYVPSFPHMNSQVHIQTHKPDQTKINIDGFDMAKLLYGPVLVFFFIKSSISGHVILFPFSGFNYLLASAKCTQCCLYRQNVISANTERISSLHSYYIV